MSERPGRYQRSFAGMIGAMLALLLAVAAFVAFRSLVRADVAVEPEPVDFLPAVEALQAEAYPVAYPGDLPQGWVVTSMDLGRPGARVWGLGMLTEDEAYAGIRQEDAPLTELVDAFVDEGAEEGEPQLIDAAGVQRWRTFSDDGGDFAYGAEVSGKALLVYGSATPAQLRALVEALTTDPAAPRGD